MCLHKRGKGGIKFFSYFYVLLNFTLKKSTEKNSNVQEQFHYQVIRIIFWDLLNTCLLFILHQVIVKRNTIVIFIPCSSFTNSGNCIDIWMYLCDILLFPSILASIIFICMCSLIVNDTGKSLKTNSLFLVSFY